MTAQAVDTTTDQRKLDESAALRLAPSGKPLALRWHGSIWQAVGNPVACPSSLRRGDGRSGTAHGGSPAWLFRAQTGPASPILEFGVAFDPRRDEWRLLSVGAVED